jgi:hypothetical protein
MTAVEWYVARASGIVSFAVLTVAVLLYIGSAAVVAGFVTWRAAGTRAEPAHVPTARAG